VFNVANRKFGKPERLHFYNMDSGFLRVIESPTCAARADAYVCNTVIKNSMQENN
jgi:hypothetical protein